MNRQELQIRLDELNVPKFWYSLDGEAMPDKTILQKGGGIKGYWVIYGIDERGNKSNFKEFYYEEEACEHFYQIMKKAKERNDRINSMPLSAPSPVEKQHTFTVSETGEIYVDMERTEFNKIFYHDVFIRDIHILTDNENSNKKLIFILESEESQKIKCHIFNVFSLQLECCFKVIGLDTILDVEKLEPESDSFVQEEVEIIKKYPDGINISKQIIPYKITTNYGGVIKIILYTEEVFIEKVKDTI